MYSDGPYAYYKGPLGWETMYHGLKSEAAYSILSAWNEPGGGMVASDDKSKKGNRFNDDSDGVYYHKMEDLHSALSHARRASLFGEGTHTRMYVEAECDRTYRMVYKHRNHKAQLPNDRCAAQRHQRIMNGGPSIFYKGLHVQCKSHDELRRGSELSSVWTKQSEARPRHMIEEIGDNQDDAV